MISGVSNQGRRPRTLSQRLARLLVVVAFTSVATIGGLNYFGSRLLLDTGTREVLAAIGSSQAHSIETGAQRLANQVSAAAADGSVAALTAELSDAFAELEGNGLSDTQRDELDRFYDERVVEPLRELDLAPGAVGELRPGSDAGSYLHYHYVLPVAGGEITAAELTDAGDESRYSRVHAVAHSNLTRLAEALGANDILLIDVDGNVVYSTRKYVDLGVDLDDTGYYQGTRLTEATTDRLPSVPLDEPIFADYELYLPGGGRTAGFILSKVRNGSEVVGTLAVRVPLEALNQITGADRRWEQIALGRGEAYLVGGDLVLRSESRAWLEDPERFLARTDAERSDLIAALGSPVGLQRVDTAPVRAALEGATFAGRSENYLGTPSFSYATPIDVPGLSWVVVVDVPWNDVRSPLRSFLLQLAVVLLTLVPVAAVVGVLLARRLTKPVRPLVELGRAVAAGERPAPIGTISNDEFGDLTRRFISAAARSTELEESLQQAEEQRRRALVDVLPRPLVEEGADWTEVIETDATIIAVRLDIEQSVAGPQPVGELAARAAAVVASLAAEHGLETVRSSADLHLLAGGLGDDSDGAEAARRFVASVADRIHDVAAQVGEHVSVHTASASGRVDATVAQTGNLAYVVWGPPVTAALDGCLSAEPATRRDAPGEDS